MKKEIWIEIPREKLCYDKEKDVEAISLADLNEILISYNFILKPTPEEISEYEKRNPKKT